MWGWEVGLKVITFSISCTQKQFCYLINVEECSLDQIKMTEWIWMKFVNMTEKFTTTDINLVNIC